MTKDYCDLCDARLPEYGWNELGYDLTLLCNHCMNDVRHCMQCGKRFHEMDLYELSVYRPTSHTVTYTFCRPCYDSHRCRRCQSAEYEAALRADHLCATCLAEQETKDDCYDISSS